MDGDVDDDVNGDHDREDNDDDDDDDDDDIMMVMVGDDITTIIVRMIITMVVAMMTMMMLTTTTMMMMATTTTMVVTMVVTTLVTTLDCGVAGGPARRLVHDGQDKRGRVVSSHRGEQKQKREQSKALVTQFAYASYLQALCRVWSIRPDLSVPRRVWSKSR